MIKKILYGIIISLIIIVVFCNGEKEKEKLIIDNIEKNYNQNEMVGENLLTEAEKHIKSYNNNANKYFILGYISLEKDNNIELAKSYFEKVIKNKNKDTSDFAFLYSCQFMSNYFAKEGDMSKAIDYAKTGFNTLDKSDYNKNRSVIWNMFRPILSTEKGLKLAIDSYNEINSNMNFANKDSKLYISKKLAVLDIMGNKYVYAIENILNVISLSEELNRSYDLQRAIIDLGVVARQLGEYDEALKILNSCNMNDTADEARQADINIYKYTNLAEVEQILGNYENSIKYINEIDKYKKYLKPEKLDDVNISQYNIKAQYYIEKNNLKLANEYLTKAKKLLDNDDIVFYVNKDIEYYCALGNLNLAEKNYSEAEKNYNKALKISSDAKDNEYIDICLKSLQNLYVKNGDEERRIETEVNTLKFKESTNKAFAENYFKNATYKFNESKIKEENENIKFRNLLLKILILLLFIVIFIINIYPRIMCIICKKKIRGYINENKYLLNYQPIINPKNNKIVGVEALIRLKINEKIIMPNVIIQEIEKCNMMGEVSIWILKKIIKDYNEIKNLKGLSNDFYISMNISLREIENDEILNQFLEIFKSSNIEKNAICIEITENNSYNNQEKVRKNINKLSNAGFLIALDDFGVDYSNISILERFKFDTVKLDKYFIDNINESSIKKTVIETADYLAITKNKSIVIEGVEEAYQVEIIKKTISDRIYIQGYFYSKPVEIEKLKDFKVY